MVPSDCHPSNTHARGRLDPYPDATNIWCRCLEAYDAPIVYSRPGACGSHPDSNTGENTRINRSWSNVVTVQVQVNIRRDQEAYAREWRDYIVGQDVLS